MARLELTEQQAIRLFNGGWWVGRPAREIAEFQLEVQRYCCPFRVFHDAVEESLGRSVETSEFASNWDGLLRELQRQGGSPSFANILQQLEPSE